MIETDAPYITPVPHRGKRNEPSFVRFVAEKIALIRSQTTEEVLAMTSATARSFFGLLVMFTLTVLIPSGLFAQSDTSGYDEVIEKDEHPYAKTLGFGPLFATNTIVEAQTDSGMVDTRSFTYEGVFSYGGVVNYMFTDRFMAQAAYVYTKNTKVLRGPNNPFGQQHPNTHQTFELAAKYLWNPYSRVVFYCTLGGCLFENDYNGGDGVKDDSLSLGRPTPVYGYTNKVAGICAGLGLFAHIRTPFGLIVPGGEWRIDFFLKNEDKLLYRSATKPPVPSNVSTLFSLPRFTLLWYPKL